MALVYPNEVYYTKGTRKPSHGVDCTNVPEFDDDENGGGGSDGREGKVRNCMHTRQVGCVERGGNGLRAWNVGTGNAQRWTTVYVDDYTEASWRL